MSNNPATVCKILTMLREQGLQCDLFGGWAEELLGLRTPGPHRDIDLIYRSEDFAAVDEVIEKFTDYFQQIPQKRFAHKRAVIVRGVMCEFLLVQDWLRKPFTMFWGDVQFLWETPFLHESPADWNDHSVSVVSGRNLNRYRSEWKSTQPHRWRDPRSRVPQ